MREEQRAEEIKLVIAWLNKEDRRKTDVAGIFPNEAAIRSGMVPSEQHDERQGAKGATFSLVNAR